MHDDDDEGGNHKYDLWAEDHKTRRHREWTEDYQRDADLGHAAELEREVQEFESGVAVGAFTDDEQAEIIRKLIRRGVSPSRLGIRKEDRDRASQTDSDQQSGTDKEIRTDTIFEGSPQFEFDVSGRRQLSDLEIKRDAPVAFVERGLVSTAAGGYDLACELLRGYFLILQNPMTKETEHIVTTQIFSIVQGIENHLRLALETLVLQLWQAKTLHVKAKGICRVCRAEPMSPFVQVIVNAYGTTKEIGPDKQIVRVEPSKQTIYRALLRLGKTRNRPVSGKSAREKASNLVARIEQTAPLLWVGKDAILRTVEFMSQEDEKVGFSARTPPKPGPRGTLIDKVPSQGRIIGFGGAVGAVRAVETARTPGGCERRGTFSKSGRQKTQVPEKPIEKKVEPHS